MLDMGHNAKYSQIAMNKDATFYVHTCLGPSIPEVVLRSVNDKQIKFILENNDCLKTRLQYKGLSEKIHLTIKVGQYEAPAVLQLPKGYDKNANAKYPLLIYVYGGPGSQFVGMWPMFSIHKGIQI